MVRKYLPKSQKKVLRGKNVKRRTGAKAQSKQIMALTKQVRSLNKTTKTRFNMAWQRKTCPIEGLTSNHMYICPINYMPSDPYAVGSTNVFNTWSDNTQIPSAQSFNKFMLFQAPDFVSNCKHIYHTGSVIKYQLTTNEPDYTKVNIALIRPKKRFADQLTIDRQLLGGPSGSAGSTSFLTENVDFTAHNGAFTAPNPPPTDTVFGLLWNKQYFDVLYNREVAFSHPLAGNISSNTNPSNTSPKNNSVIHTGYIRVPAGGVIQNVSKQQSNPTVRQNEINAIETSILDCRQEDMCYLTAYSNGSTLDGQTVQLAFRVLDSYTATN